MPSCKTISMHRMCTSNVCVVIVEFAYSNGIVPKANAFTEMIHEKYPLVGKYSNYVH